jgi:hypothetical protein
MDALLHVLLCRHAVVYTLTLTSWPHDYVLEAGTRMEDPSSPYQDDTIDDFQLRVVFLLYDV